jgi:hypothetical protein
LNTIRENTRTTKKLNEIPKIKYETGIIVDGKRLTYGFCDYFLKAAEYLNINNIDPTMAIKLLKKILA